MKILTVICLSVVHFVLWCLTAVIAFGSDLDQISSRSPLASAAASVYGVLQVPQQFMLHAISGEGLSQSSQVSNVAAIALCSLLWGIALTAIWQAARFVFKGHNEGSSHA